MTEPKDKLRDPLTPRTGVSSPRYVSQVDQVRRETAMGGLVLSLITFVFGTIVGGGIVGALVAIF